MRKKILFDLLNDISVILLKIYKLSRFSRFDLKKIGNSSGGEKRERVKGKGYPLLPLPANEGEDSENAVCSCKQMVGNYLQFAIYTPVLALSPARRLSFSALSFHPGAIHRLPGNCQRSAPRNAGVAGQ